MNRSYVYLQISRHGLEQPCYRQLVTAPLEEKRVICIPYRILDLRNVNEEFSQEQKLCPMFSMLFYIAFKML